MSVFQLSSQIVFPSPHFAEKNGLLAIGGDLKPQRLICAYQNGIFPWYSPGDPILWWSPDPRLVLFPDEFHVSRSLKRLLNKRLFSITADTAFHQVITQCAVVRKEKSEETWIVPEMIEAYLKLHQYGLAHSIETWREDDLVGGIYGVSMGRAFFGESMFTRENNASKVALATLVSFLRKWNFHFIDCQVPTQNLIRFGAKLIPRDDFMRRLGLAVSLSGPTGKWILDSRGG